MENIWMAARRLLIVEDEFLIRMTLAEVLGDEGWEIAEAGDAREAKAILDQPGDVAVLLTDIQLPGGMDGRALAAYARTTRPNLPVIFMSGRPDPDAASHPNDLHVSKPYLPSAMVAAVHSLIGD